MAVYLSEKSYVTLVEALLNLPPCPMTGERTADAVKIALGEHGDVWPETIRPETMALRSIAGTRQLNVYGRYRQASLTENKTTRPKPRRPEVCHFNQWRRSNATIAKDIYSMTAEHAKDATSKAANSLYSETMARTGRAPRFRDRYASICKSLCDLFKETGHPSPILLFDLPCGLTLFRIDEGGHLQEVCRDIAWDDIHFIDDGANPAPDGVEFIGDDEERDHDAVERAMSASSRRTHV